MQTIAEVREEVITLRLEVNRLGSENHHLLEMKEGVEMDIREEVRLEIKIEFLKKHRDAGISNKAQGILMRCEILQLYVGTGRES